MEGKTLVKVCKDCHLMDTHLTTTDIDLVFAKVKAKGARRINLKEFKAALSEIAHKKKMSIEDLTAKILSVGGPVFTGTKVEKVKWHDDKSTYTGVYAKGGPTNVDIGSGMISDISQLCDRTNADVRGVKKQH